MDLITLDSDFRQKKLVERWKSLIWTERYLPAGEFQLKTTDIQRTMDHMPLGSYISLLDTSEVAKVETFSIEEDSKGKDELTILGRTFETVLEERSAWQGTFATPTEPPSFQFEEANMIDACFVLITGQINNGVLNSRDIMDNVFFGTQNASEADPSEGVYSIEPGEVLYDQVLGILREGGGGIRSVRHGWTAPTPGVTIQVRVGVDRTTGQTTNEQVLLRKDMGHLSKPKYLMSVRGHKNTAHIWTPGVGARGHFGGGHTDLDRKILQIKATDLTENTTTKTDSQLTRQRARQEIRKHRKTNVFEAEISPNIPYKYKKDYDLGDKITVVADYGVSETKVITEVVRSESSSGYSEYPSVSSLDEVYGTD